MAPQREKGTRRCPCPSQPQGRKRRTANQPKPSSSRKRRGFALRSDQLASRHKRLIRVPFLSASVTHEGCAGGARPGDDSSPFEVSCAPSPHTLRRIVGNDGFARNRIFRQPFGRGA